MSPTFSRCSKNHSAYAERTSSRRTPPSRRPHHLRPRGENAESFGTGGTATHHLRLRGENVTVAGSPAPATAPPPPMRRELEQQPVQVRDVRTTSAYAERTAHRQCGAHGGPHHLRLRGENQTRGAIHGNTCVPPPPTRRERRLRRTAPDTRRTTSAYAERTSASSSSSTGRTHHLRLRGENHNILHEFAHIAAPPPPTRREPFLYEHGPFASRTTSAYVERTATSSRPPPRCAHHLRLRGENFINEVLLMGPNAPPPPTRRERHA